MLKTRAVSGFKCEELFVKCKLFGQFLFISIPETEDKDEAQIKRVVQAIKESVQGFTGDLNGKTFIHEGALIELDPDNHRPICRVYFFLLNDLLIVGKVKHDK